MFPNDVIDYHREFLISPKFLLNQAIFVIKINIVVIFYFSKYLINNIAMIIKYSQWLALKFNSFNVFLA